MRRVALFLTGVAAGVLLAYSAAWAALYRYFTRGAQ